MADASSSPAQSPESAADTLATALLNPPAVGPPSSPAPSSALFPIAIPDNTSESADDGHSANRASLITAGGQFGPPKKVRIKLHLRVGEPRSRLRQLKDLPDPPEWLHDLEDDDFDILLARVSQRVAAHPKYRWQGVGHLCIQPTKNSPQRAYEDVTRQTYKQQLLRAYAAEIKRLVLPEEIRVNLYAYVESSEPPMMIPAEELNGGPMSMASATSAAAAVRRAAVAAAAEAERSSSPYPTTSSSSNQPHHGARPSKRTAAALASSYTHYANSSRRHGGASQAWSAGRTRGASATEYVQEEGDHYHVRSKVRAGQSHSSSTSNALRKRSPYEEEDQLEPSEYDPRYEAEHQTLNSVSTAPAVAPVGGTQLMQFTDYPPESDMEVDDGNAHQDLSDEFREIEIEIQGARLKVKVSVASLCKALGLQLPPPTPSAARNPFIKDHDGYAD